MTTGATVNIASHLVVMAGRQPGAAAVLAPRGKDTKGDTEYGICTYQQLNEKSDALARGLKVMGVERGMRTALCVRPGVEFFAITFALFKMGAVPVLIDPGIGLRNFGRCLTQAAPAAFIGMPLVHVLRRVLGWAQGTVRIAVTTGRFGGKPLEDIRRIGEREGRGGGVLVESAGDDPAAILFTSGSTGPAKGVVYTHANFDAQVRALKAVYGIQPGEIDLATFPLFGLFGPALGMSTVIPEMDFTRPGFVNPRNVIAPIQQLQITNMFGSPALLDRVSQWGSAQGAKLPSLRRVISAGAPVPAAVMARFATMLGPGVEIFTPYGATESLPVCSIGSAEILGETAVLTDAGKGVCVGRPVGGMKTRIIRISDEAIATWTDDLEVPAGQVGEIAVQGPVVTAEYYQRPDATRLAKIAEPRSCGFYHRMGDVGYFDEKGRVWFCGRKSHRVRTAKGDWFSTPVEGIFNTHPKVYRSALVGVAAKARDGQEGVMRPVVCIELRPEAAGADRGVVRQELLALAKRYSHTAEIEDFLFHRRFPVDIRHNAKIGREKLAVWATRKLS